MKRIVWWTLLASALVVPAAAQAETYYGFTIGITNAPPPPVVVIREEPQVVYVPRDRVYIVNDDRCSQEMYRFGATWYIVHKGYWYKASNHRGPFRVVDARKVPKSLYTVMSDRPRFVAASKSHPHGKAKGHYKSHGNNGKSDSKGYGKHHPNHD